MRGTRTAGPAWRTPVGSLHPRRVTPTPVAGDETPTVTTGRRPTLRDDELVELLALMNEADSVELKLTVPESHQYETVQALEIDPLDAQIRQVFFFDTPDLLLDRAGVAVRARRVQGRPGDSTVKLRPVVPHELSKKTRRSPNMVVEVDAMPGGHVCSASMKSVLTTIDARDVAFGHRPVRKLFSKEQREFFEQHAPEGADLDGLSVLGPILVLKLKFAPRGWNRKIAAELWNYPDFSRVLELSTRTVPGEAFQVRAEAIAFLMEHGVPLSGEQQTKTRTALEFFSERAAAAGRAGATAARSKRPRSSTGSSAPRRAPAAT